MRRSKAPSVLKNAKRLCNFNNYDEEDCTDPADEQYAWGSRNIAKFDKNKRIFNVVWRDISTRKHKIWKGDGTLEVSKISLKAILKDETGKYIGCSTKLNKSELMPDFQMLIGGKEIEIQNEIIGEEQLLELRKRQIENRNWDEEEWISVKDKIEEDRKPKGGFQFKPILVLKTHSKVTPDVKKYLGEEVPSINSNWTTDEHESKLCLSNITPELRTPLNTGAFREYICFLKPSELQQFLFQKVLEYISSNKTSFPLDTNFSLDIEQALKLICNHPSLINHKTNTNSKLIRHLIPALPDWTEMGPFDSVKLEFVQYFLTDLSRINKQNLIIFAKNCTVLNMLQGLCNFMNIKCLQLNINLLEDIDKQAIEFFSTENESSKVLLLNSVEIVSACNFFTYCKKVIFFEEVSKNINSCLLENVKNIIIYNLVTAFSIEELLLLDTYNSSNMGNLLEELVNTVNTENACCYLHSKIGCNCFESTDEFINSNIFIKNWKHFKNPFAEELLKISSLENSSENIVSIFCKRNKPKLLTS